MLQLRLLQLLASSDSFCRVSVTRQADSGSLDLVNLGHPPLSQLSLSVELDLPIGLRFRFNRVSHVESHAWARIGVYQWIYVSGVVWTWRLAIDLSTHLPDH